MADSLLTLDSFQEPTGSLTIDDFTPERATPRVPENVASNRAFYASALSSSDTESLVEGYQKIKDEFVFSGASPAFNEKMGFIMANDKQKKVEAALSIMADPKATDEQKQAVVNALYGPSAPKQEDGGESLARLYAEQIAARQEEMKDDAIYLQTINSTYMGQKLAHAEAEQKQLNVIASEWGTETKDFVLGIGELMLPMVEGDRAREIAGALIDKDPGVLSGVLYGSTRKEMKAALEAMTPQQRHDMKMKMLDVASKYHGSDMGEFFSIMSIMDEDYTNLDKVVDNIFGVLDALVAPGIVARSATLAGRSEKAASLLKKVQDEQETIRQIRADLNKKYEEGLQFAGEVLSDAERAALEAERKAAQTKMDEITTSGVKSYEQAITKQRQDTPPWTKTGPLRYEGKFTSAEGLSKNRMLDEVQAQQDILLRTENQLRADDAVRQTNKNLDEIQSRLASMDKRFKEVDKHLGDLLYRPNKVDPFKLEATLYGATRPAGSADVVRPIVSPVAPLSISTLANPPVGMRQAAVALQDASGEVVKALGTTKDRILSTFAIPRNVFEEVKATPSIANKLEEIANKAAEFAYYTATQGRNVYEAEKAAARANITSMIENVEGAQLISPMSKIDADDEVFRVSATYGKTKERGFLTSEEAFATLNKIYNKEDIIIYKKDNITNNLLPVSNITKDEGEYFVTVDVLHKYSAVDALAWGDDVIRPSFIAQATRWIKPLESRYDETTSTMIKSAEDMATSFEKHLLKDLVEKYVLKPLSMKERSRVMLKLMEGSEKNKTFKWDELAEFSMKEKEAYYAFRLAQDIIYAFTDRRFTETLQKEGWKRIDIKDMEGKPAPHVFGAEVKSLDEAFGDSGGYLYDFSKGNADKYTKADFLALEAQGKKVVKLRGNERIDDGHIITHAVVDGINSTIDHLPKSGNLHYIDGYIQRSYKNVYFIEVQYPDLLVNGRKASLDEINKNGLTIRSVESLTEAKQIAEKIQKDLVAGGRPGKVVARPGDEYSDFVIKDMEAHQARITSTKRRGDYLVDTSGKPSDVEDALAAVLREVRAVSRMEGYGDMLQGMRDRFVKTYAHELGESTEFPMSISDIRKFVGRDKEYKEAVAWWKEIKFLEGGGAVSDRVVRNFFIKAAEIFENLPVIGVPIARQVRKVRDFSPVQAAKRVAHEAFIRMRPLRMLVLQPSNLMQYTLTNPKYVLSGRMALDISALTVFGGLRGGPHEAAAIKALSKTLKMDEANTRQFLDNFWDKSGLVSGIDRHVFAEGVVRDMHMSHQMKPTVAGLATLGYSKLSGAVKKVGFDAGEFINVAGSYLLAKRRWEKANPNKVGKALSKSDMQQISSWARTYAGSMSRVGTLGYQQGLAALPLQFISVPHKMMFNFLPQAMGGSRFFSPQEKAAIAAANFVQFGAYSVGISNAMDMWAQEEGIDTSTPTWIAIKGGVVDWAANVLATDMLFSPETDDGTRIAASKSFAPLSEGPVVWSGFFENLASKNFFEAMVGPSGMAVGRVMEAIGSTSRILFHDSEDLWEGDRAEATVKAVAGWMSGASDYYRYTATLNTGRILSSKGNVVARDKFNAAVVQLFGFQTYEEVNNYYMQRKLKDREKSLNDEALRIKDMVSKIDTLYLNNPDERLVQIRSIQAALAAMDERDRNYVRNRLFSDAKQDMISFADKTEHSLFKRWLYAFQGPDKALDDARNSVKGLPPEQQAKVLEVIDIWTTLPEAQE